MARDFYIADDYAGLKAGGHEFYYGYEYVYKTKGDTENDDGDETWGFIHKGPSGGTKLSYRRAKDQYTDCPARFDTSDCLLWFVALMIDQGKV